jgi:hypothetical protein
MTIARVFPRRTAASPTDALAFFDEPGMFVPAIDAVHVSVAFTYDMTRAEWLARSWERLGVPVSMGGPATGERGDDFVPGRYLRDGYVITSRGCPNRCWFCSVWRREGTEVRELPITEGHNLLDDNLLACSEGHIRAVFAMLKRQKQRAEFTGGLEAARLLPWHVDLLADLRPAQAFFAYDTPDDYEPLVCAGKMLAEAGYSLKSRTMRCFVLMGFPKDTRDAAEHRCVQAAQAGFLPMGMLWRDKEGNRNTEWATFQRTWARPAAMVSRLRELGVAV